MNLRKIKKGITGILCAVMLVCSMHMAVSAENDVSVVVNGSILYFDSGEPQIIGEGTTMVPFRAIFEALGFSVDYKAGVDYFRVYAVNTKLDLRVDLYIGDKTFYSCSNNMYATTEGDITKYADAHTMPEAPFIDDTGRTLVPARAIAELAGADVKWEQDQRTVYITYDSIEFAGDNTGGYYAGTEIPTYNEITGVASKAVDDGESDEYTANVQAVVYAYDYNKTNYDKYIAAIEETGCVKVFEMNDDENTAVYESTKNDYLYVWKSSDSTLAVMPVTNMDIYLNCPAPNYTYYTGRKCFQWQNDGQYHLYYYVKDRDEYDRYAQALKEQGYVETSRSENKDNDTVSIKYTNSKDNISISIVESENFVGLMPYYTK